MGTKTVRLIKTRFTHNRYYVYTDDPDCFQHMSDGQLLPLDMVSYVNYPVVEDMFTQDLSFMLVQLGGSLPPFRNGGIIGDR